MRKIKLITLIILVFSVLFPFQATAQEILEITPSQLNIQAVRQQTISRTILIRANQSISNLSIIPLDLKDAEGGKVLPAEAISVESETNTIDSNGMLTVVINIDLRNISSGHYSGELIISFENGNWQVPITVSVKDQPYLAALVLVAGVALGLVVSEYRSKGKPRDEILVNLGQIRTQIKVDTELQNQGIPFYDRINAELVDVEVALEAQQWDQATTSIDKARVIWNKWRRGRSDWLIQIAAYSDLVNKLDNLGGKNVHFLAILLQNAEDTLRKTPTYSGPDQLREQLLKYFAITNTYVDIQKYIGKLEAIGTNGLAQAHIFREELAALTPEDETEQQALQTKIISALDKINRREIAYKLDWLTTSVSELTDAVSGKWVVTIQEMRSELENLPADDQAAFSEFTTRVDASIQEVKILLNIESMEDSTISPDISMSERERLSKLGKLTNVPEITLKSITTDVIQAGGRLKAFTYITYGVAVILLALAGYVELYVTRNDFGTHNVADYFSLLAWGFGAEATRAAITDMVTSWGIVRK